MGGVSGQFQGFALRRIKGALFVEGFGVFVGFAAADAAAVLRSDCAT
jgi:hypothetical protein